MNPSRILTAIQWLNVISCLDLVAKSEITACYNTGGGTDSQNNCSYKLLISAAIQNGESYGTGSLRYNLFSALSLEGGVVPLDDVTLVVTQSSIRYVYPLTYFQDFNDGAYEVSSLYDANNHPFNPLTNPCQDSPSSSSPACGWVMLPSGAKVPYSQGFCCSCTVENNFLGYTIARSGLRCDALSATQQSAHCLRMSSLWWSGFTVGAPSLDFTMNLQVTVCRPTPSALAATSKNASLAAAAAASSSGVPLTPATLAHAAMAPSLSCSSPSPLCSCSTFNSIITDTLNGLPPLGPSLPSRCYALPGSPAGSCDVLFTLIGTFVPSRGVPDLSGKLLLLPTACDSSASPSCYTSLIQGWDNWMLVDKGLFSFDGRACNSVGTSYQAFNTQGTACAQPLGTCLGGSPGALLNEDLGRVSAARAPLYLLKAFSSPTAPGGLSPMPKEGLAGVAALQAAPRSSGSSPSASSLSLLLPTGDFQKSLFTLQLTASASTFRMVTNVADGILVGVAVPTFPSGTTGELCVTIRSTGLVDSLFTLAVSCPAPPALPIPARAITLGRQQTLNASMPISVVGTHTLEFFCNVTLLNSLGGVSDFKMGVGVRVGPLEVLRGSQGGEVVGGLEGGAGAKATNSSGDAGLCGASCASWFDITCAIRSARACADRLVTFALGSMGLIAGLVALLCLLKNPALVTAFAAKLCSLFSSLGNKNSSSSSNGGTTGSGSTNRGGNNNSDEGDRISPNRRRLDSANNSSGSGNDNNNGNDDPSTRHSGSLDVISNFRQPPTQRLFSSSNGRVVTHVSPLAHFRTTTTTSPVTPNP